MWNDFLSIIQDVVKVAAAPVEVVVTAVKAATGEVAEVAKELTEDVKDLFK